SPACAAAAFFALAFLAPARFAPRAFSAPPTCFVSPAPFSPAFFSPDEPPDARAVGAPGFVSSGCASRGFGRGFGRGPFVGGVAGTSASGWSVIDLLWRRATTGAALRRRPCRPPRAGPSHPFAAPPGGARPSRWSGAHRRSRPAPG